MPGGALLVDVYRGISIKVVGKASIAQNQCGGFEVSGVGREETMRKFGNIEG